MEMYWNALSGIAAVVGAVVAAIAMFLIVRQLREMRHATVAQAFSTIVSLLNSTECREARKVLISNKENDFEKWSEEERAKGEIAGNAYDIVGIMVKRGVIDYHMVTNEWRMSIINCWKHAAPMLKEYRQTRQKDHWKSFEWLYHEALKEYSGGRPADEADTHREAS